MMRERHDRCCSAALRLICLFLFSEYSTYAYNPPPQSVRKMPMPLVMVMCKSKRMTARAIVRTCLQLECQGGKTQLLTLRIQSLSRRQPFCWP